MGAVALGFASCGGDDDDDDYGNGSGGSGSVTSYTHCPDSHHPHAIDLGLPSGTKWACCNVGASTPEADGDYFAWGETKPKSDYSWDTYKWEVGDAFTKYTTSSGKTTLDSADDAATQNMGKRWRMPTAEEFEELIDNCYKSWTEENGIKGYKFISVKTLASIFLPASGGRGDASLNYRGSEGHYWSSSLSPYYNDNYPYDLYFYSGHCSVGGSRSHRFYGLTVRAVCQ